MASIVKRKKKFSVVYTYIDDNGNKRQRYESGSIIPWRMIPHSRQRASRFFVH